jgi:hypothetical protein
MPFGFSVRDILAGVGLAYNLYQALSDAKGSAQEYEELIAELNVVHKVLLQVEQLRASNQLAQVTLNAMLFIVNSANEAMESFLLNHEAYADSLKVGGSGNVLYAGSGRSNSCFCSLLNYVSWSIPFNHFMAT